MENPGLEIVSETIQEVLDADDYLEVDEACGCLVACEVIARLQGRWGKQDSYSEELDSWIKQNPTSVSEDLKKLACAAIDRILAPDSELQELWDEDGRNDDWHAEVDGLRQRIMG